MSVWWSIVLTLGGVFGLWLAGRKSAWGWAVGLCMQSIWLTYAIYTRQWGFIFSAFAYGGVYARNLFKWLHEKNGEVDE